MKKFIFSVAALSSLAFSSNAVMFMCVKGDDGNVVSFEVEHVDEVYYEDRAVMENGVSVSGKIGDYSYVDLGLSVKWATFNVGATKPNEYGKYFAWGETDTKESYSGSNYKLSEGKKLDDMDSPMDFTKYCGNESYGTVDNKNVLESTDDAAFVNWGSDWRMPTSEEMQELIDGCVWEWTADFNDSGISGFVGVSKVNKNIIFLPAAGNRRYSSLYSEGSYGRYWSSTLEKSSTNKVDCFYFEKEDFKLMPDYRFCGRSVRAVVAK